MMGAEQALVLVEPEKPVPHSLESQCASNKLDEKDCFRNRTVTVLDWDDTLLASTFLATSDVRADDTSELPSELDGQLRILETLVTTLLRDALVLGDVVIITNAEAGWVELSAQRFLPGVLQFIQDNHVKVVSARTQYEEYFPDSPESWKIHAFASEVNRLYPDDQELNVLVFGDSASEMQAARILAQSLPAARVKAVAFKERPSIEELEGQLSVVLSSFREIVQHDGSFDVRLVFQRGKMAMRQG